MSRAVARELRRRYGEHFRVIRADSAGDALDALRELKLRGEVVAAILADYRMPQLNGIAFLEQAMDLFSRARRALLTAYADTDAAIQAINVVDVDHYLLQPWDPPEEKLYPACAGRDVYIVGGANSAGQAAVFFARHAERVVLLVLGESLRASMSHYLIQQLEAIPNVSVRPRTVVAAADGGTDDGGTGNGSPCATPPPGWRTRWRRPTRSCSSGRPRAPIGWTGCWPATSTGSCAPARTGRPSTAGRRDGRWPATRTFMESSLPGVFVAGDVRAESVKRVASAVGEGAMAVTLVHRYLGER